MEPASAGQVSGYTPDFAVVASPGFIIAALGRELGLECWPVSWQYLIRPSQYARPGLRLQALARGGARCPQTQPWPRVLLRKGAAFSSTNLTISPAMFFLLAVSMPSSPGEEFTSMTSGPRLERSRSTPATFKPMI